MPWPNAAELKRLSGASRWVSRPEAEVSDSLVQPIACAILHDGHGNYCISRRRHDSTRGLAKKISLVFGGHVDEGSSASFWEVLLETLTRELDEEIGLKEHRGIRALGRVVDLKSLDASRHVAFVYEVVVNPAELVMGAQEEFTARSKFNLAFLPVSEIKKQHSVLDPWSSLILDYLLVNGRAEVGRQIPLVAGV